MPGNSSPTTRRARHTADHTVGQRAASADGTGPVVERFDPSDLPARGAGPVVVVHDCRSDREIDGRSIVRRVVAAWCGVGAHDVDMETEPKGKPRLVAPVSDLTFNLSDADEQIAVAFACGYDVGVDIERADRRPSDARRLARRVLSPRELATVDEFDDEAFTAALIRYWTRKEAVLKGSGHGLRVEMNTVDTVDESVDFDGRLWRCRSLSYEDLVVSVAWAPGCPTGDQIGAG